MKGEGGTMGRERTSSFWSLLGAFSYLIIVASVQLTFDMNITNKDMTPLIYSYFMLK